VICREPRVASDAGPAPATGRRLLAVLPLTLLAQEAEEHASTFLGLPLWLWQLVNLVLFLGALLYFVARPIAAMFRNRQLAVEERLREAKALRAEAARLEAEVHERMARLDQEIAEIRARGLAEGETERATLSEKGDREVERVRREADEEIGRRLAAAKQELRRTAADLTAGVAREVLAAQINDEDRRRLLEESVTRLGANRAGDAGA
jgi:F0F1-type ATP synthase membrane subunit b/b'